MEMSLKKPRLLIIKSINDETTLRDAGSVVQSKRYGQYEVYFFYPIQMSEYKDNESYVVPFFKLLDDLEQEVASIRPQKILLHAGIAFRTSPASFLQALAVIKSRYPEIGIWHDHRRLHRQEAGFQPIYPYEIALYQLLKDNELFSGDEAGLLL